MIIKQTFYLLWLFVAVFVSLFAEAREPSVRQYFSSVQQPSNLIVDFSNGVSTMLMTTDVENASRLGFGTHLTVGYAYLWNGFVGFQVGIGVHYATNAFASDGIESQTLGYLSVSNNETTSTRRSHYTATISSVREDYKSIFVEVPIKLTLQGRRFWFDCGGRLLLPVSMTATYDYGETSIGLGRTIDGFGTTLDKPVEIECLSARYGDYTIATLSDGGTNYAAIALTIGCGYRWVIDDQNTLKIGAFVDFALNQIKIGYSNSMVDFGNAVDFHPVLQSNVVSALRYANCGITLTYNFAFAQKNSLRGNKYGYSYSSQRHKGGKTKW